MKKRSAHISAAMLLTVSVMTTACSSANEAGGAKPTAGKAEPPVEISITTDFTIAQPPAVDNPVWKEFEKKTNSKLNITWIAGSSYTDRMNVLLSSGDLPDLIKINDVTNPMLQQMSKQGAFWDLTPFLKDYPNLMTTPKLIWDRTKINGKNYVIPVARPVEGNSYLNIRKDWIDKLGLKVPETMDDLYKVLKAFKENAPDGKKDTYGIANSLSVIEDVFTGTNGLFNGTTARWGIKDGKLYDANLIPEMREALLYEKKLFDEGILAPDFAAMKSDQVIELFQGGRLGTNSETIEALWRWQYDQWKRDPKVDWLPLTSLSASHGPYVSQSNGYIGVLAISKKVPEAKLKKILSVIDYGASEEGGTLSLYGVKDVHYKDQDGFKVATELAPKDSVGVGSFGKIFMRFDPYMYAFAPGMPKEVFERNKKIIDARSKFSTPDPVVGLASDTRLKVGADFDKKIKDMKVQVVMGKVGIEAWDKFVNELKQDASYQKIAEETNAAYKSRLEAK
jgi:putative aldouronate transport system substrate-binding protein